MNKCSNPKCKDGIIDIYCCSGGSQSMCGCMGGVVDWKKCELCKYPRLVSKLKKEWLKEKIKLHVEYIRSLKLFSNQKWLIEDIDKEKEIIKNLRRMVK